MPRPTGLKIDTSALHHNLALIRRLAPHSKTWALVKANAYGHRIDVVLPHLRTTTGFAVCDVEQGVELRKTGWQGPVLIVDGTYNRSDLYAVEEHTLTLAVQTEEQLRLLELARFAKPIYIEVTVANRNGILGFHPNELRDVIERVKRVEAIRSTALYGRIDATTKDERKREVIEFSETVSGLKGDRSYGGSAEIIDQPRAMPDWVRAGVILYGASPASAPGTSALGGFLPVMRFVSKVVCIRDVASASTTGSRWGGARKIGVVACGYADGYPDTAAVGTPVAIDGIVTRVLERVSMDTIVVDLDPCPGVHVGSEVELWGQHVSVDLVAAHSGTTASRLLSSVSSRLPLEIV
ncbi:alanine racemase [Caballeronia concitans]|uniref:Alanine racemase n=1 Tax=Caballeronia concitans TaxID=1777133 RepID=A0A658QUJ4_9BURK|nr:alanine racemase [Caballeronia concitans]KIG07592.1 Alanine racemase [Burkholderia sp. MR1]SAL23482.1 alanine racemase [Caballeronia concitans]